MQAKPALPPGVLALRPYGPRNSIFWVHYLSANLAKAVGDDQPFLFVTLTAQDVASLDEAPTLQGIAACLVLKILATQSKGPYTIGGFCLGGILAYEIAFQLRAAGPDVSLLVLLDAPNPSFLKSRDSLRSKLRYLRYAMERAARVGPRSSFRNFRERLLKQLPRSIRLNSFRTDMSIPHEMIEAAAARGYQPKKYEEKVLLILASERPPHLNFLPGWQAVVPHDLHARYVEGHRRDLMKAPYLNRVADAILYHLNSSSAEESYARGAGCADGEVA